MKHITFVVEPDDSELNSSLGIASALVDAGYRVSYATSGRFVPRVIAHGAEPFVYQPLDIRNNPILSCLKALEPFDRHPRTYAQAKELWTEFVQAETFHAVSQLRPVYQKNPPNLIIYDWRCLAGRSLASQLGIPKMEHAPTTIGGADKEFLCHVYDDDVVLVSVPKFFQRNAECLDNRFHFIGPLYGEARLRASWDRRSNEKPMILVSGSNNQPIDFFRLAINCFAGSEFHVVLSIGHRTDPNLLSDLPPNFEISQSASTLDLLSHASILLGHGGQSSTLETLYRGVPLLLLPRAPLYEDIARRIVELGLGARINWAEASVDNIRATTVTLLEDQDMRARLNGVRQTMEANNSPNHVVDLVRRYVR